MDNQVRSFTFEVLPGLFAVCRLAPSASIPGWATSGDFFSITRTNEELSVVCRQDAVPGDVRCSADWGCLKLVGPFALDDTGIVASVTTVIANAGIGVFVVSTFDGDHLLVKEKDFEATLGALNARGHIVKTADVA